MGVDLYANIYTLCFFLLCVAILQANSIVEEEQCPSPCSTLLEHTCSYQSSDEAEQIIESLYTTVAEADCDLANPCDYPPNYCPEDSESFDFIVVGAGSAGATVAGRLSEVTDWKVLLIEAGGNPTKTSDVPALLNSLYNTPTDWQYQTDPSDSYCLGMEGNKCNWPRGKFLGGSSTNNFMVYSRGNSKIFDMWDEEGCHGWGYEDVLPYFKKSEDMRIPEIRDSFESIQYHGIGGGLKVEKFQSERYAELISAIGDGIEELGYHKNSDYNGKNQTGFVQFQATLQHGRRCSSAKAFLSPAVGRNNLKIAKYSFVSKILVDNITLTANGVELTTKDNKIICVYCTKEIILSAGAINSPQLLMLSGIGPGKHLDELNIKVIKDLPVGEHLQDHPLMNGLAITLNDSLSSISLTQEMFKFLTNENSSLSGIGLSAVGGFLCTEKDVNFPNIELYFPDFEKNSSSLPSFLKLFNYRDDVIKKYLDINADSMILIAWGSLLRPYSRGRISLKSTDPKEYPSIIPGYFLDQRDVNALISFVEFISKLAKTKGLQKYGAKLIEIEPPGCEQFETGTRAFRECSLRHLTGTTSHASGTCRMGAADSHQSVVDPELRVMGVNQLRVMDASIMPLVVNSNPNAATIMIAEKGSDIIKMCWGQLKKPIL